ncbi:hypothetical protein [Iodidimonas gelatinilytica]|nr:hypothetical protein [Iodidimonas gelatinilytica]
MARNQVKSPALIVIGTVALLAKDWPQDTLSPILGEAPIFSLVS